MVAANSTANSSRVKDLTGQQFGKWTVLHEDSHPSGRPYWLCRCECGNERSIRGTRLRAGKSLCCGCRRNRPLGIVCGKKHGMSRTAEYAAWQQMRGRCENSARNDFHLYGGRGIRVCERWQSFEAFYEDMGPRPSTKHTLDRFPDKDGNYEPGNCRWATREEQARNTRRNRTLTYRGKTMCVSAWSEALSINVNTLYGRLRAGWSIERALTAPVTH
jgi:hypothetical protein